MAILEFWSCRGTVGVWVRIETTQAIEIIKKDEAEGNLIVQLKNYRTEG